MKQSENFKSAWLYFCFVADFKTICGNIPGFTFDIHTGKAVGEFLGDSVYSKARTNMSHVVRVHLMFLKSEKTRQNQDSDLLRLLEREMPGLQALSKC